MDDGGVSLLAVQIDRESGFVADDWAVGSSGRRDDDCREFSVAQVIGLAPIVAKRLQGGDS